jgi:ABC-type Fe3+/spermidine/putrescine transport system ATPase subunit
VFVTHDQEEAVVLADRIALLFGGELQMYDEPEAFYDRPASREAARFFGATNFIEGEAKNGSVDTPLGKLRLERSASPGETTLTIRPEAVRLDESGGENSFPATVSSATYLGTQVHYELEASGVVLRAALPPHVRLKKGDEITARLPAESLWALE